MGSTFFDRSDDGLLDEDVNAIDEIPLYPTDKPRPESLAISNCSTILKDTKNNEGKPPSRIVKEVGVVYIPARFY